MNKNPKLKLPPIDLTNRKFTRWTVTGYAGYKRRHLWRVVCECGETGIVGTYQLEKGKSKSCGCYAKDSNGAGSRTHGETSGGSRSPEYRAYSLAKNQCRNPAHENYAKFGGKGIEFKFDSFDEFLKAVGRKPAREFVLTRTGESGNYETGNIEWTKNKNRLKKK